MVAGAVTSAPWLRVPEAVNSPLRRLPPSLAPYLYSLPVDTTERTGRKYCSRRHKCTDPYHLSWFDATQTRFVKGG